MKDGLKISDPMTIQLADYCRLRQTPVYKNGNRVNWPIILKLTNAADKRRIFNNLKNLKSYNEKRKEMSQGTVYITEHLLKLFQEERKLLMPYFKKTRRLKQKTHWRAENGHYCLYIDNVKVDIPYSGFNSENKSSSSSNEFFS